MLFVCPFGSWANNYGGVNATGSGNSNLVARSDYAGCVGNGGFTEYFGGPGTNYTTRVDKGPFHSLGDPYGLGVGATSWAYGDCTGVVFECAQITSAEIPNGMGNVIFCGEKYVSPDDYTGIGINYAAENENMYVGMDNDISRSTNARPAQDRAGYGSVTAFGSAHLQGANFAMCDGTVRCINYFIDGNTFYSMGARRNLIRASVKSAGPPVVLQADSSGTLLMIDPNFNPVNWSKLPQ
jgi:hypothetical protein